MTDNPLLSEFYTPPFSKIDNSHWMPAIEAGIGQSLARIDEIASLTQEPTFENTVEALERASDGLDRTLGVFYPLLSANADDEMMDLGLRVSALLSDYSTRVSLNIPLFKRISEVYSRRESLGLDTEQSALLEKTYQSFLRSGANLQGAARERYREITARLSELTTRFGQNVKKELALYSLGLTDEQTAGLPDWLLEQAAAAARGRKSEFPYVITLDAPVYMAFMRLSPFDGLRRQLYEMYSRRNTGGEFSNVDVVKEIAALRLELARLLGHETFADYRLVRSMAGTPAAVCGLLDRLREAYAPALRRELDELRDFAGEEITPWNYSFHFDRLRKARYDFDPESMRPYFELSAVTNGVFSLATKLYGLQFVERGDVDVYHPDVRAFEVRDSDGSVLGLLYADFFPRPGRKSPGAWMTEFREADGTTRPLVNIVMNFTPPGDNRPSLLSPGEVTTFLHEFGHALHSLLTRVRYSSIAGTNVFRDFVEFPSQFNENFFTEPEFIDSFARHYQSGEPMPRVMLERLRASEKFGAAYAAMRQLGFGYLDMAFHTITGPVADVAALENEAMDPVRIFPPYPGALTAVSFGHIFSGGYAAGYYSYKWAEVLDADAFALFKERGVFNESLAASLRRNVLERGGAGDPSELYVAFRGCRPSVDALLKRTLSE